MEFVVNLMRFLQCSQLYNPECCPVGERIPLIAHQSLVMDLPHSLTSTHLLFSSEWPRVVASRGHAASSDLGDRDGFTPPTGNLLFI